MPRQPWERRHPCLLAFEARPFFYELPTLQDLQAWMGGAPRDGASLAIHIIATVEDFEILRRIDIVSVKVWLLRRWRLAQGFFQLIVEGEAMNTFACATLQDLLIPLGFVLGLGVVIALVIIRVSRSGGSR